MDNRKQQTDTKTPRDVCSLALASAEAIPHPPKLKGNHRQGQKGRGKRATPRDSSSSAFASAEEMSHPPELQRNRQQERERQELKANNKEEDASSVDSSWDKEMRLGAVAVPGVFTGPTIPSVLSAEP
jgi:hypothetical protein